MQVSWKYDNNDIVVVTGADSPAAAWDAAESFLQAAGDNYSTGLPGSEGIEKNESGYYEFGVKTY